MSSFKWMASPCTDMDIEGSSLIFAVVRQQGSRTNNTDTASTVTSSTSISGGTHSHLKAAFPERRLLSVKVVTKMHDGSPKSICYPRCDRGREAAACIVPFVSTQLLGFSFAEAIVQFVLVYVCLQVKGKLYWVGV